MYDVAQCKQNRKAASKLTVKTRSSNKVLLKIKRPNSEKFRKSLAYTGLKRWKSLPAEFHKTEDKPSFKNMVSDRVTRKAFLNVSIADPQLSR